MFGHKCSQLISYVLGAKELNKQYAFFQILMSIVCMYDCIVISMK